MPIHSKLPVPVFENVAAYGAQLGDAAFWAPYIAAALTAHGLPAAPPRVGAVGTFPTFLAGEYAVKFFGPLFDGLECHAAERSLHRLLLDHPEIRAPRLVADGVLYPNDAASAPAVAPRLSDGAAGQLARWTWPYVITTRLDGASWREAGLSPDEQKSVARELGAVIRRLHALPCPPEPFWQHDHVADMRATCVERHRHRNTLPPHLVDQIADYLLPPSSDRCLVHADLHADHIFVVGPKLVGVIDWGDAIYADPYYELPPLHLDTFRAEKSLLAAFLDGYGWDVTAGFAHRAMSMTLVFYFNVMGKLREHLDLDRVATLDELAERLWHLP